jgi:glutamate/tyrosine decarboxylase-like PLP-dependent enzyme
LAPGTTDLYRRSLQWSRRFIGLKVFMTLAELGAAGVAALVDHQVAMGKLLRETLSANGWRVTNDSPLPLVCFTHDGATPVDAGDMARTISADGVAWLSELRMATGEHWLRACITHHETKPEDVRALVAALNDRLRPASA